MFQVNTLENNHKGVKVIGEVDIYTVTEFKESIEVSIEGNEKELYMDLTEMKYIDSTGIGTLIELRKKAMEKDMKMILINPQKNIIKLLQLTGVDQIFEILEEKFQ